MSLVLLALMPVGPTSRLIPTAVAHALPVSSDPAALATLRKLPSHVSIRFDYAARPVHLPVPMKRYGERDTLQEVEHLVVLVQRRNFFSQQRYLFQNTFSQTLPMVSPERKLISSSRFGSTNFLVTSVSLPTTECCSSGITGRSVAQEDVSQALPSTTAGS